MRRLFEDPQLSAELRQDLMRSRAAGQDYPTSAKLLQLRAALSDPARLALPEPPELGGGIKQLAWRLSHPAWKLVVLVAVGGTIALVARPPEPAPQPAQSQETVQLKAAPAPRAEEPAPEPPLVAAASPAPAEVAAPAVQAVEPPAAARPAAPATNSSRREIAQLVRIRALLDQDPSAAYQLAVRSEREHPRGLLTEERRALAIIALAKTGDQPGAQRKAREFFARYPQSTMREVIEAALRR